MSPSVADKYPRHKDCSVLATAPAFAAGTRYTYAMFALHLTSAPRILPFLLAALLLHLVALYGFGQVWLRPASTKSTPNRGPVSIALQNRAQPVVANPANATPTTMPMTPTATKQSTPRPGVRKRRAPGPQADNSEPAAASANAAHDAALADAAAPGLASPTDASNTDSAAPTGELASPAEATNATNATDATNAANAASATGSASATPDTPPAPASAANSPPPTYRVKPLPSIEIQYALQRTAGSGDTSDANAAQTRGRGSIRWQNLGQQYRLTGEFKFLFFTFLRFQSEGELDGNGIAPLLYSEKKGTRSLTNTHFQRNNNTISFSASTKQYPRSPGAQDWASVVWQLAGIGLADSEKFQAQAELEIVVAGARDATTWRFRVQGLKHLVLDNHELDAWHLSRIPLPGSRERQLDIWLSPQHQFAPARILQTDPNGSQIEMKMTAFTLLNTTEP